MKITLGKLLLENYKCFKGYVFDPGHKNVTIRGRNGSGKTTLYDGFLEALFGKCSDGRTDYKRRPLDANNQPTKEVIVVTECTLNIDGQDQVFRTEQHEKLQGDRAIGYTGKYFIDGVPKLQGEYKDSVNAVITEDTFKILTDLSYFCEKMHWNDRRQLLMKIAGDIETPDGFDELLKSMGGKDISDYKAMLKSRKKGYVEQRDQIPIRIDEKQQSSESYIGTGDTEIELIAKRENAEDAIKAIADERQYLSDSEARRQECIEKKNDLSGKRIEREAELKSDSGKELLDEKAQILEDLGFSKLAVQARKNGLASMDLDIKGTEQALKSKQLALGQVRNEYIAAKDALQLLVDTPPDPDSVEKSCYACKQELPDAIVQKTHEGHIAEHAKKLQKQTALKTDLAARARKMKDEVRFLPEILDKLQCVYDEAETELAKADIDDEALTKESHTRGFQIDEAINNRPTPDFTKDTKWGELTVAIGLCETEIGPPVNTQLAQLDAKKGHAEKELAELNKSLANIDQSEKDQKRIVELKSEQRDLSQSISDIDKELEEVDCYTVQESLSIELAVNDKFKDVQFRLFDYLMDGTVNDKRCDATFHGVPYSDLSTGEQIKVGANIVNVLSEHYDVSVPLWIDHAECLTLPIETDCQTIKLFAEDGIEELEVTPE
ncbi:hypothetical protein LCGC14_1389370 [marine sediment metagenome]|uniref:Rad50/SbcC-type AAA domain-containing protein n=1 Tax=marine sediment metagenome TaxID=412755 RepID=A0A0F9N1Z4_9ZZZZ